MSETRKIGDVSIDLGDDLVATLEICRGPNNFFDQELIAQIAEGMEWLDESPACRAVVLCSEGKHFCAGANFQSKRENALGGTPDRHLYDEAVRLFATKTPAVAAIQGAAIGGGLGLALWPDFRVACDEARFAANFSRLGFVPGFGLTKTLPMLVGKQAATDLFFTGRRMKGDEALAIGLVDELVDQSEVRSAAHAKALEIARSAPLAIDSIRQITRGDLSAIVREATNHERAEQERLQQTDDFREGTAAMAERRLPQFQGR